MVLVTGIGAVIGYGIIESLRKSKYPVRIIGIDIYPDAVGQEWCDAFETGVPAASAEYPEFLCSIIKKHRVNLVLPGIEQDITRMVQDFNHFRGLETQFALNDFNLIAIAADKWLTYERLRQYRLPAIKTYIDIDYHTAKKKLGLPMLVKPRNSYASKGIYQIYSQLDFDYWKAKLQGSFMVQQIVGDDASEYTVSAFGYGDGTCSKIIALQRRLSGEGATAKAKVIVDPKLEKTVYELVHYFKPVGPTNFQFRFHEGEFLLLEINPRFSSATSLRTAFGFNEAEMCIEYFLEKKRPDCSRLRLGRAVRYIEDLIYYDSDNC